MAESRDNDDFRRFVADAFGVPSTSADSSALEFADRVMNTSDASSSDAVFSSSPSSLLLGAVHAHVRSAMSAFERDVPPEEFRRRMLAFWTGLARLLQRAHAGAEA